MSRIIKYSFLLLVLFALSSSLYAQQFRGAVMAGMNITQVDGDLTYGFHKVGAHLGLAAILPIKKWDITLETVYSQKGARQKAEYDYYDSVANLRYTGEYSLKLDYVEVPLVAHYTDRDKYTVGLGFSYGRLVSSKEIEHGGNVPAYSDTVAFNKNDFSILGDIQIRVWKQLKFNVRYEYSLTPIRERTFHDVISEQKDPWTRKQYNNLLTFRLVYVFNEQYRREAAPEDLE